MKEHKSFQHSSQPSQIVHFQNNSLVSPFPFHIPYQHRQKIPMNHIHNKSWIPQQYQPSIQGYLSLAQSTKLLEQELKFYQMKNLRARQQYYGQVKDYNQQYNISRKRQQFGHREELEQAIHEQEKQRKINKPQNSRERILQEKTSVRIQNPPGGKSSIVFG